MLERERREGVRREKTDEERDSRRLEEKSGREMRTESTGEGGYRREKRDRREQRKKDREERRQGREQDREERRRSRGAGEAGRERLLADGRGPGWDQKFMKRHRTKQAAQTRIIVADQTSVRDSLGVDRMLSLLRRESSEHRFLGVGPRQRWTRNQRHRTK
jgi:hypothetical protein